MLCKLEELLDAARNAENPLVRKRLLREVRRLENTIFQSTQRAASKAKMDIIREGRRWFQQQGSFDANLSHCVKYLKENGIGIRVKCDGGRSHQLGDLQMRNILRTAFGIGKKKAGRPRRS